jgi:hypothetical protein
MPRNVVIAMGVLLWASFAVVAVVHAVVGDWMGPVVAGIVVTTVVVAWHMRRRLLRTS